MGALQSYTEEGAGEERVVFVLSCKAGVTSSMAPGLLWDIASNPPPFASGCDWFFCFNLFMAASSPSCEHVGSEVVAQGVWDLSSLTRDQNFVPCIGMGLTTEPPGKSPDYTFKVEHKFFSTPPNKQ
ncbi:unnamed protein product [Rangifer tarandus platyrhynchus]|uniref:Uncharacterized protein n=1 Tax=Rangifer tarandus platyrhynchus TaxID=3082113 RepID=A0ABN8YK70_RANTA|nr:unnamed protein product [Rangifer tarandus platyrhynchus]